MIIEVECGRGGSLGYLRGVFRSILCPWFKILTEQVSHVCVLSLFQSCLLFATLWAVAWKTPLTVGFSRQEYWNGLPCSSPRDLPNPGIEPVSLATPALAGGFFATSANWEAYIYIYIYTYIYIHVLNFFSIIGYYKILNIVPCAIIRSLLLILLTYNSVYLLISRS